MIRTVHWLEIDDMDDLMIKFWLDERGERYVGVMRSCEEDDLPLEQRPKPYLFTHEEPQPANDLLVAVEWDQGRVHLKSRERAFTLDVSSTTEPHLVPLARRVLRHMNYDDSFELMIRREKKPAARKAGKKSPGPG